MTDASTPPSTSRELLLETSGLTKRFPIRKGIFRTIVGHVHAVEDVTLQLRTGETLGIVGESGCGKSTLVQTILRLLDPTSGSIRLYRDGRMVDVTHLKASELKPYRRQLQIVFQDPAASMNPRFTVEEIISEPLVIHGVDSAKERRRQVGGLLESVGLSPAIASRYPGAFSGGQRQRIGIARALALRPRVLVLDEPVSALDVSVQSQILNLLKQLKAEHNLSYLFIAHHLDIVRYMSDRILVMYLGRMVEQGTPEEIYRLPLHPYTEALLGAIPAPHPSKRKEGRKLLAGDVPDPARPPGGCPFHLRCPYAEARCRTERPILSEYQPGRHAACHFAGSLSLAGRFP